MDKTLITAIASIIAFILLVINTIAGTNFQMSEDVIMSLATLIFAGIMWFISHYYNQDYSMTAKKITPIMRKIKKMVTNGDLSLLDALEHLIYTWEEENEDN